MTYLELVNSVLTRLREETITQDELELAKNPYWEFIGTAVNDAKARVEDAWEWGALRGTDSFQLAQDNAQVSGPTIALPDSQDGHYLIKRIATYPNTTTSAAFSGIRTYMRWVDIDRMRTTHYSNPDSASVGQPMEFAVNGVASTTGLHPFGLLQQGQTRLTVWPYPSDDEYWVEIDRVKSQPKLVSADTRLKVPPLPVLTLATALASRERGEVGGTPTSELFAMADNYLSDAIAQDAAMYANELDWWANTNEARTNVRFA